MGWNKGTLPSISNKKAFSSTSSCNMSDWTCYSKSACEEFVKERCTRCVRRAVQNNQQMWHDVDNSLTKQVKAKVLSHCKLVNCWFFILKFVPNGTATHSRLASIANLCAPWQCLSLTSRIFDCSMSLLVELAVQLSTSRALELSASTLTMAPSPTMP